MSAEVRGREPRGSSRQLTGITKGERRLGSAAHLWRSAGRKQRDDPRQAFEQFVGADDGLPASRKPFPDHGEGEGEGRTRITQKNDAEKRPFVREKDSA